MENLNEIFQAIIDSLSVHLYWTDRETRVIGANLLQARNFGDKDVVNCIGKDSYDFANQLGWSKEFADALHQEHLGVINNGKNIEKEYIALLPEQEPLILTAGCNLAEKKQDPILLAEKKAELDAKFPNYTKEIMVAKAEKKRTSFVDKF